MTVWSFAPRLLATAVFALAISSSTPAAAVYQCGPDKDLCQCGMNNPYPCCSNGGNCTWWAWDRACCGWAKGLPGWGNANQWAGNAKAHPSYKVLTYPVVGSIANRVAGTYGHVAWVTAVSGSNVTVTEQNCWGGWGHQAATRDKSYYDGGYIVPNDQCQCQPGATQTQSCGKCGQQTRTCASSCQWGSWSTCSGQGACVPGETAQQACGNCGTQKRSCSSSCSWGSWETCGGQGACAPGATEQQACGDCGTQTRSCQEGCGWSEFDACASDPAFTPGDCTTSKPGPCAKGIEQCVDGTIQCASLVEPAEERCDGIDNDCDGVTDENVCWQPGEDGGSSPTPPKPNPAQEEPVDSAAAVGDMEGGCACAIGQRTPSRGAVALALALLCALGAGLRRRSKLHA
jgi:surface antigen